MMFSLLHTKKKFFLLLLTIFVGNVFLTYAAGSKSACLGQPLFINYSSSNVVSCSAISHPSGYAPFTPTTNTSTGYNPGNANANSGVFSMSCSNGVTTATDNTTLTVDTTHTWDTINSVCANPQVVSATILGQYYPPGVLSLTCSGSDHYSASVLVRGVPTTVIPVTPYFRPVTFSNITLDGSYTIKCMHGSVSSQVARTYAAVPPPATVKLNITPITITKGDAVVVKWDTTFPTNACTLTAKVVCANNTCTAAQTTEQTALNAILTATTTDFNDPSTSRSLQTAIKTVAPGHRDSDPVIITLDWKALGKKTLRILYTTDLTYACSPTSKETKRIQVTKSELQ